VRDRGRDTIYTLKLRRRGIDIEAPPPSRMAQITVAQAMGSPPQAIAYGQSLVEIAARFAGERGDSLPVINAVGSLMGVIAAKDVEHAISHGSDDATKGAALARDVPHLGAADSLEDAMHALAAADDDGLPVTDQDDQVIGWITHRRVLRTYLTRFGAPEATAGKLAPPALATATPHPDTPADGPRR
jgi:CIC family chloride channel protein